MIRRGTREWKSFQFLKLLKKQINGILGMIDVASHTTGFNLITSNIRNQFNASLEYGWNKNLEGEVTYERYLHDYLRVLEV
jgi:hypothetical protein